MFWRRTPRRLGTGTELEAACNAEALAKARQGKRRLQGWKGIQGQTLGREFGAGGDLREGSQDPSRTGCRAQLGAPSSTAFALC